MGVKIKINPDHAVVEQVNKGLLANNGYCPCSLEQNENTKCMCKDFRESTSGICHCGKYIKEVL